MAKKMTVELVAKHAGVSPATVSRVINHPELVSAKTIARVNASIRELGYASLLDRYRSAKPFDERGPIVVNIPWLDNPFYSEIVHGIRDSARAAGYDVLILWDTPRQSTVDSFCESLRRCGASGLITMCSLSTETIERIDSELPTIQCAENNPETNVPYVTIDDRAAARTAVEHLIACGCKHLSIISGPESYKYSRGRMEGFLSVTREHELSLDPSWILQVPDNNYELACSAATHMLESDNPPDGVFACSDTYAAAVIRAARKAGLSVPGDLMVVGFDNIDIATMTTPTLTTVNQPRYRMGYGACNLLLERMSGNGSAHSMVMETELIVRESTARRP